MFLFTFAAKNALIFCANCYDEEFATRCDACGDTFRPGIVRQGKILQYPNVGAPELPSNFSPIWLCPPYVFVDKHFKH